MPDKTPINTSEAAYALLSDVTETSIAFPPPWYYQTLIKLLKPIYRVALWRRHKKAIKSGIPVADYKNEIQNRFGHSYPDVPVLAGDKLLDNELPNSKSAKLKATDTKASSHKLSAFYNATVWCHAVSLGETNTIAPMLMAMLDKGAKIWMTNTTQTGFARTEALFADALASRQMVHSFVPVDDMAVIEKFVKHVNPDLAMFVETELWANILTVLNSFGIPSVLVNARLSQKSYERYAKYARLSHSMMQNITMIIAQDVDSAKRFRHLGTPAPKIRRADSLKWSTGNFGNLLKNDSSQEKVESLALTDYDFEKLKVSFSRHSSALDRPIWVAGSTHEGEEALILQTHKQLIQQKGLESALLILVPRHPERFDDVAQYIEATGLVYHRRSLNELIDSTSQVYLADTMGELKACYAIADVALVGGSLVNIGGHNPVEAASLAKPIIMGPYTQSCHELVEALVDEGALKVVKTTDSKSRKAESNTKRLLEALKYWLSNKQDAKQAGKLGQALVVQKSEAMQKQMSMIEALLAEHKAPKPIATPDSEVVDFDYFKVRRRTDD